MIEPANAEQLRALERALNGVEKGLAGRIIAQCDVVAYETPDRSVPDDSEGEEAGPEYTLALVSPEAAELPPGILADAVAAGLPLGAVDAEGFGVDLQGAVLWADATKAGTVRVTERAARLFLYGRHILGRSVLWYDGQLRVGDTCVVCDPRGDALGLGTVVGRFKGDREAVRSAHDLGAYLRDQ